MNGIKGLIEAAKLCRECRQVMNAEEIHYYEYRCEKCEREWAEKVDAWRHGAEDKAFDAVYGNQQETLH